MKSRFLMLLLFVFSMYQSAKGDGLIYKLPPDGCWATFHMVQHGTEIKTLNGESMPDMSGEGTFTVRSVGEEIKNGVKHRWIEFEFKIPPIKVRGGRIIVLKMLIPESSLRRGVNSLADVTELFFGDRNWDWEKEPEPGVKEMLTDKPRIQYELERVRQQFPYSPQEQSEVRVVNNIRITTPLNTYDTQSISYPTTFKGKLTGGKGGRWEWSGNYSLWLSDASPFGVVAVESVVLVEEEYATTGDDGLYQLNGQGVRMKTATRLELASFGKNAKSSLPDLP